tara:strand:+ start:3888 stop:4388 length:501 start_codon:yes stop_codon:yes gene_type:complete
MSSREIELMSMSNSTHATTQKRRARAREESTRKYNKTPIQIFKDNITFSDDEFELLENISVEERQLKEQYNNLPSVKSLKRKNKLLDEKLKDGEERKITHYGPKSEVSILRTEIKRLEGKVEDDGNKLILGEGKKSRKKHKKKHKKKHTKKKKKSSLRQFPRRKKK